MLVASLSVKFSIFREPPSLLIRADYLECRWVNFALEKCVGHPQSSGNRSSSRLKDPLGLQVLLELWDMQNFIAFNGQYPADAMAGEEPWSS